MNMSCEGRGKTAAKAKEELTKATTQLNEIIKAFEAAGMVITSGTLRSSASVAPHMVYKNHEHVKDGFKATSHIQFQTESMDVVNDLYDALISVDSESLSVSSPTFKIKKIAELQELALKDAWERVRSRFNSECKVLGVASSSYVLANYVVTYDDSLEAEKESGFENYSAPSRGAQTYACTSINIIGETPAINAGKANIGANLTVSFIAKTETTTGRQLC
jgi:uncharacterized protein YggE